jgi:hypothetical protein
MSRSKGISMNIDKLRELNRQLIQLHGLAHSVGDTSVMNEWENLLLCVQYNLDVEENRANNPLPLDVPT